MKRTYDVIVIGGWKHYSLIWPLTAKLITTSGRLHWAINTSNRVFNLTYFKNHTLLRAAALFDIYNLLFDTRYLQFCVTFDLCNVKH